jgi:hypothetical protein
VKFILSFDENLTAALRVFGRLPRAVRHQAAHNGSHELWLRAIHAFLRDSIPDDRRENTIRIIAELVRAIQTEILQGDGVESNGQGST